MAEHAKVGDNGDGGDNKMVKRSLFRKLSGSTEYLISLLSNVDSVFLRKKLSFF